MAEIGSLAFHRVAELLMGHMDQATVAGDYRMAAACAQMAADAESRSFTAIPPARMRTRTVIWESQLALVAKALDLQHRIDTNEPDAVMAEHSSAAIELVELIEHMINHGSSLNMNWGEDTGGYEVDWITSGKRFHGYDRSLTKAMEQAIRSAHTHFEVGETPLTAKEQVLIDAAWQTHRDALNLAAQQPSDRPQTLLDGFGEATEQVVALRAEVERLRAALAESERVSGERLERIGELRDALIRIEADSRKLGVAPGQLGDTAGRALVGHKPRNA